MEDDLRYPIGRFTAPEVIDAGIRKSWMAELAAAPGLLRKAVEGLTDEQLDTPYRPGGWTVRQVVHHMADSHMNSFIRFKLALTEENPTIKPYHEDRFAGLADSALPAAVSLELLEALHTRWGALLEAMNDDDWERTFRHPETGAEVKLARNLGIYAWHGKHHIAHITALRQRMGW